MIVPIPAIVGIAEIFPPPKTKSAAPKMTQTMSVMILTYWNFPFFPRVDDYQRDRVIGRDSQIRRHVKGRAKTDDHNADHKASGADKNARLHNHRLQKLVGKLRDVTQQKQIDESRDSNVMPVKHKRENQKQRVDDDVQKSKVKRNQIVQAGHKRLEGVNAKRGDFKNAYAYRANYNAKERHQNSLH